jgi:hypothetical protein
LLSDLGDDSKWPYARKSNSEQANAWSRISMRGLAAGGHAVNHGRGLFLGIGDYWDERPLRDLLLALDTSEVPAPPEEDDLTSYLK